MSALLTTGKMVDKLKVGQVAELIDDLGTGGEERYVLKTVDGLIWCNDPKGNKKGNYVTIACNLYDYKWKLLPHFVSFQEALQALKEGRTVVSYVDGIRYDRYNIEDNEKSIELFEIFECPWVIED